MSMFRNTGFKTDEYFIKYLLKYLLVLRHCSGFQFKTIYILPVKF